MASWSGKSRGGALGYQFLILTLKYTHISVAYFILRFVAVYFLIFSNKKSLNFYFQQILRMGKVRTLINIYKNYNLLGQVILDKITILSGNIGSFTFELEGEQHLQKIASDKKGGLLIGAHMGNWEIAGPFLERLGTKINVLMLEAEHKKIKQMLDNVQVENNINIIPIKDDQSHLFRIADAFKNNEFVAMHSDRFLPGTSTTMVDFLGKPARFPVGPLYLASKHRVPVSFVFTMKDSPRHYHFYATPGKVYPYPSKLKTRKAELKNMVLEYVQALEEILKKYPLQWFNYHPFWDEELS